jgi:predicted metal-dependent HD superfamily phosphohydrolase
LSHIKALVSLYDEFRNDERDDAILFAIWYHDIIYDTRRNDNEDASADYAHRALGALWVAIDTIAEVEKMIRATKDHGGSHLSTAGQLFLDLDISILGAPSEVYNEYSRAIRTEYDWVPSLMYREARSGILRNFLQRQRIFFSEQISAKFEDQARRNLEDELKQLAE